MGLLDNMGLIHSYRLYALDVMIELPCAHAHGWQDNGIVSCIRAVLTTLETTSWRAGASHRRKKHAIRLQVSIPSLITEAGWMSFPALSHGREGIYLQA